MKINNILIQKCEVMNLNPAVDQNYYSGTAIGIYIIGHNFIRLTNWWVYYDRFYY